MSGIELAPLVGMVIPITVAFFSCADESHFRHVCHDERDLENDATMLRVPGRTTVTSDASRRRRITTAIQHRRRNNNELDVAIFRLDRADDDSAQERRDSNNDFLVTSTPIMHQ